jgi:hypothetical protein
MIAETAAAARCAVAEGRADSVKAEIWLPFLDAFRTILVRSAPTQDLRVVRN